MLVILTSAAAVGQPGLAGGSEADEQQRHLRLPPGRAALVRGQVWAAAGPDLPDLHRRPTRRDAAGRHPAQAVLLAGGAGRGPQERHAAQVRGAAARVDSGMFCMRQRERSPNKWPACGHTQRRRRRPRPEEAPRPQARAPRCLPSRSGGAHARGGRGLPHEARPRLRGRGEGAGHHHGSFWLARHFVAHGAFATHAGGRQPQQTPVVSTCAQFTTPEIKAQEKGQFNHSQETNISNLKQRVEAFSGPSQ